MSILNPYFPLIFFVQPGTLFIADQNSINLITILFMLLEDIAETN